MIAEEFLQKLKQRLREPLPGEKAHKLVTPKGKFYPKDGDLKHKNYRESAVSVIIHRQENIPRCILIQRPSYDGIHGGQAAFPGGKKDASDQDLVHTARRESSEEIGFPMNTGELIGKLSKVIIPVSSFIVQPFIFWIEELPPLIPDQREVESIFFCNLFELADQEILTTSIRMKTDFILKDVPYFDIGNRVVWGATALMLSELKMILNDIL